MGCLPVLSQFGSPHAHRPSGSGHHSTAALRIGQCRAQEIVARHAGLGIDEVLEINGVGTAVTIAECGVGGIVGIAVIRHSRTSRSTSNPAPLVHNGGVRQKRISLNRFVELCSTTPAKMFGLFPRKGTIAVGSDADIVVFDPKKKQTLSVKTLHMKVDYNPYEGTVVEGAPTFVVAQGRVIIEGDTFVGKKGAGRFIKRGPSQAPAGL